MSGRTWFSVGSLDVSGPDFGSRTAFFYYGVAVGSLATNVLLWLW